MVEYIDGWVELKQLGLGIAYQAWLPDGFESVETIPVEKRILAYPGWLDNSGTWKPLGPYFATAGYGFVAIDPLGCGKSSHRSKACWYNDFEECHHICQVADELGWNEPFILCAHSRGSNVAITTAGGIPHRLRAVILVESTLGVSWMSLPNRFELPSERMDNFENNFQSYKDGMNRSPKIFRSFEEAVLHNLKNPIFKKSRELAEAIVERHVAPLDNEEKYVFTHDTRTYGQVQSRYVTSEVNLQFLQNVRCPVVCVLGNQSTPVQSLPNKPVEEAVQNYRTIYKLAKLPSDHISDAVLRAEIEDLRARFSAVTDFTTITLDGSHHLHGDVPDKVAKKVIPWLDAALERTKDVSYTQLPTDFRGLSGDLKLDQVSSKHLLDQSVESEVFDGSKSTCGVDCNDWREMTLELDGLTICAKLWGDNTSSVERVIAWCDARDNSGSFDQLATHIIKEHPNACICAVDPPGLGYSSNNIPKDYEFGITEDAGLVFDVADELGWEEFSLWGHGRGSSVALVAAGGFPNRVQSVILFDPITTTIPSKWAPSEMALSFEERKNFKLQLPVFSSFWEMEKRHETDPSYPKSTTTAHAIATRRALKVQGGWTMRDDLRVFRLRKPVLEVTFSTYENILSGIKAPVLAVIPHASSRRFECREQRKRLLLELACLQSPFTAVHVDGSSHAHSCRAEEIVPVILSWQSQVETMLSLASRKLTSDNEHGDVVSKL